MKEDSGEEINMPEGAADSGIEQKRSKRRERGDREARGDRRERRRDREGPKHNILYVDDEESNLRIFRMAFKRHFNILTATGGHEAIDILKENEIHLIITDQKMPEMSGTELLEKVAPDYPEIIRIILTGFADVEAIVKAINRCGIYKYITKPWDKGEMKLTLDKALESYDLKMDKLNLIKELEEMNRTLEHKVEERTKELEEANMRMTESINYALTIQSAMLPQPDIISSSFDEFFLIYRPRDIVSGDFYWYGELTVEGDELVIAASIDCAGHGVAGALMSMIGESLLNQIIYDKGIVEPHEILNNMSAGVRDMLNQAQNDSQHGMDANIVIINKEKKEMQYSGAKQDLYYFLEGSDELLMLKGDRMSIGGVAEVERDYTNHILTYDKTITFYMTSDGFRDQYGGERGKKIGAGPFKEMLKFCSQKPLDRQKELLDQYFDDWMGNEPQTDDVQLMGFRLKV